MALNLNHCTPNHCRSVSAGTHCRTNVLLASLVALAMGTVAPLGVHAQDMEFDIEDTENTEAEAGAEGEVGIEGEGGGGDIIGELAGDSLSEGDDTAKTELAVDPNETVEEIYAVQQIYALRINRVEFAPSLGFTVNDPFVSHPSVGLALNYWWTNVLAVGINFNWYQGFESESDVGFHTRRSTRLAIPITEYQLGANLNFTYVPVYGKFNMFNEYIFQWDAYVVGGVGIMRTRPVPVFDPEVRNFDYEFNIAFNLGIGIRVFVTRWLSIFGELRDYAFLENQENPVVYPERSQELRAMGLPDRRDEDTWQESSPSLNNNVTAHVGFTIFFPFDFEYEMPR